jgi:hypothetical protein
MLSTPTTSEEQKNKPQEVTAACNGKAKVRHDCDPQSCCKMVKSAKKTKLSTDVTVEEFRRLGADLMN